MSSEIFPHIGNPKAHEQYNLEFAKDKLKSIEDLAKKFKHRSTFHLGQFCQLATPKEEVYKQTLVDLGFHA